LPRREVSALSDFETWWTASGKIGSKADAAVLYRYWRKKGATEDELLTAITNDRRHCAATEQTCRHGSTFLAKTPNRWREWLDEEHGNGSASSRTLDSHDYLALSRQLKEEENHEAERDGGADVRADRGLPAPDHGA